MAGGRPEEYVTLREAAARLGVHYMTAYRYVRHGRLSAAKDGATWMVAVDDLEAFGEPRAAAGRGGPRVPWADRLESRLLAGDMSGAWGVVEGALGSGMAVEDVYVEMVGPAMSSIGEQWHEGSVSIGDEHRAYATATRIVGRLSHQVLRRGRTKGTVVVGTGADELHALPVVMIADLLRAQGYEVVDLGPNLPPDEFANAAAGAERLVAVGISATSNEGLASVPDTVRAIRRRLDDVTIVLGGSAVRSTEMAQATGADSYAPDAVTFGETLDELVAGKPSS